MSRSRHETVKGVFGGKSKSEIGAMIAADDEGVQGLREKQRLKEEARAKRAELKSPPDER